jgi:hypothetical protein
MTIPTVIREKARDFKKKDLQEYVERVNKLLGGMKPGDQFEILKLTRENNRELFLECCMNYMRNHEWQDGLSFSKGFVEIRKYDLAFIKGSKDQRPNGAGAKPNN